MASCAYSGHLWPRELPPESSARRVERQRFRVERLVGVEHRLQPEEAIYPFAAGVAVNLGHPLDSGHGGGDIPRRDQIAGLAIRTTSASPPRR